MRPADPAQWPTRHPCSQMGWLHGWIQTQRDLGTRRSRCFPGSRGIGGRSQHGHVAGRAARRTPAAPAVGPPYPLECRSPSPGGCLGQMQEKGVKSKERADDSCLGPLPAGPRGHQFSQTGWWGPRLSLSLPGNSCFKSTGLCRRLHHPWSSGSQDQRSCPNAQIQASLCSPYSCFSFCLFADFPAPPTRTAPAFSPPSFSSQQAAQRLLAERKRCALHVLSSTK